MPCSEERHQLFGTIRTATRTYATVTTLGGWPSVSVLQYDERVGGVGAVVLEKRIPLDAEGAPDTDVAERVLAAAGWRLLDQWSYEAADEAYAPVARIEEQP